MHPRIPRRRSHVPHEGRFLGHEGLGAKYDDSGLRVSRVNEVGGHEHTGRGTAIGRLGQHVEGLEPGHVGRERVRVAGDEVVLAPGEAALTPSGAEHGVTNDGPARAALLVFMAPSPPAVPPLPAAI